MNDAETAMNALLSLHSLTGSERDSLEEIQGNGLLYYEEANGSNWGRERINQIKMNHLFEIQ